MKTTDWAKVYEPLETAQNVPVQRVQELTQEKLRDKRKGRITMKRTKKTMFIAAAAAVVTAAAVTAGAAIAGITHKESVDRYLGDGAGEKLESMGVYTTCVTENDYFRITADAVLSDGNNAIVFVTKERLTDDGFGLGYGDPEGYFIRDTVMPVFSFPNGEKRSVETASDDPVDGVSHERYYIYNAADSEVLEVDFEDTSIFDSYYDALTDSEKNELSLLGEEGFQDLRHSMNSADYLEGLHLTLDLSKNFEPQIFVAEDGTEFRVTPYDISFDDQIDRIMAGEVKLIKADGSETVVNITDGGSYKSEDGSKSHFNFGTLIDDPTSYDKLVIDFYGEMEARK